MTTQQAQTSTALATGVVLQSNLSAATNAQIAQDAAQTVTEIKAKAIRIAAQLATDPVIGQEMVAQADRKEASQRSPIRLALHFMAVLDPQTLMGLPEPGTPQSYKDPVSKQIVLNNNPDRYDTTELVDGKSRPAKGSLYMDMAMALPEGVALTKELVVLKDAKANVAYEGDQQPDPIKDASGKVHTYADLRGMHPALLQAMIEKRNTRRTNMRASVVSAVNLSQTIALVNDKLDDVRVDIMTKGTEGADALEPDPDNTACIRVFDESEAGRKALNVRWLTVSQFMALNLDKVTEAAIKAADGSQYKAFINSGGRKRKASKKGQEAGALLPTIKDMDKAIEYADEMVAWFDPTTREGRQHIATLLAMLGADDCDDDLVETFGDLTNALSPVTDLVENRYHKIKAAKAQAKDADDAAAKEPAKATG